MIMTARGGGGPMMMTVYKGDRGRGVPRKGDRGEGGSQDPLKKVTSFMNGPLHLPKTLLLPDSYSPL